MNGLPYYKAYPRDFIEGTIGMPFEEKCAYRLVLDLIYMQGGKLPDDAKYIAGLLGCSVRAWNKYRSYLIQAGKIYVEDGFISNFRANLELETLRSLQDKQRQNGSKPKENKALTKAMAEPKPSHTEPEPDKKQQPRAEVPSSPADQTNRERLLAAMGADPRSGQIGPNGRRLGTLADTEEAEKWSAMGLTIEKQCAVIAERCAAMRKSNPHWTPGRFAYFTGAMADLIAARNAKPALAGPASSPSRADQMRRYQKIAGGNA